MFLALVFPFPGRFPGSSLMSQSTHYQTLNVWHFNCVELGILFAVWWVYLSHFKISFLCVCRLYMYVYACACWCPWGVEKDARFPGVAVSDSPVEDWQVLLISELLYPPCDSALSAMCRVWMLSVHTVVWTSSQIIMCFGWPWESVGRVSGILAFIQWLKVPLLSALYQKVSCQPCSFC